MEIWSDERVELLKKLWGDGLSASQIAAQLGGVTRNAVIGKVHRLGLSGRTKTQSAPARSNRPKTRATSTPRPAIQPLVFGNTALKQDARPEPAPVVVPVSAPIPFPAPSPEQRVTILQLTEKTCRWPEGDPASAEFRFCGSLSATGLPYCAYHCAIAYQPSQERKREQRRALAGTR
jgi:GcrA cell cycle regulator